MSGWWLKIDVNGDRVAAPCINEIIWGNTASYYYGHTDDPCYAFMWCSGDLEKATKTTYGGLVGSNLVKTRFWKNP